MKSDVRILIKSCFIFGLGLVTKNTSSLINRGWYMYTNFLLHFQLLFCLTVLGEPQNQNPNIMPN